MTRRESDTSASDALFDALVAGGVLAEGADGVRTTDGFDDTLAVYHDSYHGVGEREFREAVAATFGLPDAEAAARLIAERGVTRREFVCYLAVRSRLGDDAERYSAADLAAMAGMVDRVVPDSPVPAALPDVTDDPAGFLAGRDRAVVSAWKRFCDPCEALKAELPDLLAELPEDVPAAGLDGEATAGFCATHGIESAPAFVLFRGGEPRRVVAGNDLDEVVAAIRDVYS